MGCSCKLIDSDINESMANIARWASSWGVNLCKTLKTIVDVMHGMTFMNDDQARQSCFRAAVNSAYIGDKDDPHDPKDLLNIEHLQHSLDEFEKQIHWRRGNYKLIDNRGNGNPFSAECLGLFAGFSKYKLEANIIFHICKTRNEAAQEKLSAYELEQLILDTLITQVKCITHGVNTAGYRTYLTFDVPLDVLAISGTSTAPQPLTFSPTPDPDVVSFKTWAVNLWEQSRLFKDLTDIVNDNSQCVKKLNIRLHELDHETEIVESVPAPKPNLGSGS